MPRRSGDRLSGGCAVRLAIAGPAVLALIASTLAGCQTDAGDAGCKLASTFVLPGSPLTLIRDARLDRVGDGFVLIGNDGANVRWASLTSAGVLGAEQALSLPPGAMSPRFALAGKAAAADSLLLAYLTTAANGVDADLHVLAAAADGTSAGEPGPTLFTFPDGATTAPPMIEMRSSRVGMKAGLAWYDPTETAIRFVTLDGAGQVTGGPTVSAPADAFSCLGFSDGKKDLTFTYNHTLPSESPWPSTLINEAQEDGYVGYILRLSVAQTEQSLTCSVAAPSSSGYAIAWQDYAGSWFATYSTSAGRPVMSPFASATVFGGPDLQPPLRGLVQFGPDYGVLLARTHAAELWRLDGVGNRRAGALVFPSLMGNLGEISAVRAETPREVDMAVTYADYTDTDGSAGRRVFALATCL
jgi:hypothetical protein